MTLGDAALRGTGHGDVRVKSEYLLDINRNKATRRANFLGNRRMTLGDAALRGTGHGDVRVKSEYLLDINRNKATRWYLPVDEPVFGPSDYRANLVLKSV